MHPIQHTGYFDPGSLIPLPLDRSVEEGKVNGQANQIFHQISHSSASGSEITLSPLKRVRSEEDDEELQLGENLVFKRSKTGPFSDMEQLALDKGNVLRSYKLDRSERQLLEREIHGSLQMTNGVFEIDLLKIAALINQIKDSPVKLVFLIDYLSLAVGDEALLEWIKAHEATLDRFFSDAALNAICYNSLEKFHKDPKEKPIFCVSFSHWYAHWQCLAENYAFDDYRVDLLTDSVQLYNPNHIYQQFFLDKAWSLEGKKHDGFSWEDGALIFNLMLALVFQKEDNLPIQDATKDTLRAFATSLLLLKASNTSIVERICNLPTGGFILYPGITPEHAMILTINKEPNGLHTVRLHNTGMGHDNWHIKSPSNENCPHTFYQIEGVPLEKLSIDFWEDMDNLNQVDEFYEHLNLKLNDGKKSTSVPSGKVFSDPHQESGTCSIQSLYAALKHQILIQSPHLNDNHMDYKIVKALIQQQLCNTFAQNPAGVSSLHADATEKTKKTSRHLTTNEIVQNNQFKQALEQTIQELDKIERNPGNLSYLGEIDLPKAN